MMWSFIRGTIIIIIIISLLINFNSKRLDVWGRKGTIITELNKITEIILWQIHL